MRNDAPVWFHGSGEMIESIEWDVKLTQPSTETDGMAFVELWFDFDGWEMEVSLSTEEAAELIDSITEVTYTAEAMEEANK